ncbi:hypothetical protein U1Q18_000172 [Sarracenia purpurea var. burkii]
MPLLPSPNSDINPRHLHSAQAFAGNFSFALLIRPHFHIPCMYYVHMATSLLEVLVTKKTTTHQARSSSSPKTSWRFSKRASKNIAFSTLSVDY